MDAKRVFVLGLFFIILAPTFRPGEEDEEEDGVIHPIAYGCGTLVLERAVEELKGLGSLATRVLVDLVACPLLEDATHNAARLIVGGVRGVRTIRAPEVVEVEPRQGPEDNP